MKWIIIVIIVLAILGVGYYFLYGKNGTYSNINNSNTNNTTDSTPVAQNAVEAKNLSFSPSTITVKVGDTVTFTNNDSTTHTITSSTFDSGDLTPGESFKETFNTAGTFDYHCSIHTFMTGKVIVQ